MPVVVPYVKQTWIDNTGANPVSAARMGVLEEGVLDVSQAPAVHVFHNAAQSVTSGVTLTLAFNSERYDQAGGVASTQHDTVTNNSRLTALYAGIYMIVANVEWAASAASDRVLAIRLNAATNIGVETGVPGANTFRQQVVIMYSLAVNDFVEVQATQITGGALNINSTGNFSPEFMMVRVG
jgi:hypothetical protein